MPAPLPRAIDYVEMPSLDIARSRDFFTALLGWKFTDYGPDYTSFEDGRISGGFFRADKVVRTAEGAPLVVIHSDNLEASRDDVLRLGATLTRDIFAFPGGRRFQFAEPGGGELAIWSEK